MMRQVSPKYVPKKKSYSLHLEAIGDYSFKVPLASFPSLS
jgi:hypothetical protein